MGLSRTISETDSDFSWKLQKISHHPSILSPPPLTGRPISRLANKFTAGLSQIVA